MYTKASLGPFILCLVIAGLTIHLSTTPLPGKVLSSDSTFSVSHAYKDLQYIARVPHGIGTSENIRVRSHIENTCRSLGLETEIQRSTGLHFWGAGINSGDVNNVVARLKGTGNSKAVLICSHFDSQLYTPGAGDAGVNCAAMIEVAKILATGKPLKNDIIFLFTDGEEMGLLGAHAFVSDNHPYLKDVGVVLNFDAGGNSGPSALIETNPENGWIIREYARSGAHHFASSLHYEVSKILPGTQDFKVFKKINISGLNNAIYEGGEYYHSMTDNPQSLSAKTFQQLGDNVLSLARHFGNVQITKTKMPDVIYFNVVSDWLVIYSSSLNLFFLVLANALLVTCLFKGFFRKKVRFGQLVFGFFIFALVLAFLFVTTKFFFSGILSIYPFYNRFSKNGITYNDHYYTIAAASIASTIFSFIYQLALRKINIHSLMAGILLIGTISLDLLYFAAPTATFFLGFPFTFAMLAYWFSLQKENNKSKVSWMSGYSYLFFALPALLLLPPIIASLFKVFGLNVLSVLPVMLVGILCGILLPVFAGAFLASRYLVPGFTLVCFCLALLLGHLTSGYTAEKPLPSDVKYLINKDKDTAYWISPYLKTDKWSKFFFTNSRISDSIPGSQQSLVNVAPLLNLPAPEIIIRKDTIEEGIRRIYLHCQSAREEAIALEFIPDVNTTFVHLEVNGKKAEETPLNSKRPYPILTHFGKIRDGFDVTLGVKPNTSFGLSVIEISIGLPKIKNLNHDYPDDVIPASGYLSNTTQVLKHFSF